MVPDLQKVLEVGIKLSKKKIKPEIASSKANTRPPDINFSVSNLPSLGSDHCMCLMNAAEKMTLTFILFLTTLW